MESDTAAAASTAVELSVLQCNMLSDPRVKPLDIKGGTQKDPCFLLLLSAPVKMGCFVFVPIVVVVFWCSSCKPALLLCSTTETPGGLGQHSMMYVPVYLCVCVYVVSRASQGPQNTLSLSPVLKDTLSHTQIHTQLLSLSCGQYFCWALRQNAKLSSTLGPFFASPIQILSVKALAII